MTWTRLLTPYPPRAAFPTRRYGYRFAQPANKQITVRARGAHAERFWMLFCFAALLCCLLLSLISDVVVAASLLPCCCLVAALLLMLYSSHYWFDVKNEVPVEMRARDARPVAMRDARAWRVPHFLTQISCQQQQQQHDHPALLYDLWSMSLLNKID